MRHHHRWPVTIMVLVVCAVLAWPTIATAGPPGSWTLVTGLGGAGNWDREVSLARSTNAKVWILWKQQSGSVFQMQYRSFFGTGAPASSIAPVTPGRTGLASNPGWSWSPTLGKWLVYYGAGGGPFADRLHYAIGNVNPPAWTAPTTAIGGYPAAAAHEINAWWGPSNQQIQMWDRFGVIYVKGGQYAGPTTVYQSSYGYYPNLASDSAYLYAAWASGLPKGIRVRRVNPVTGAPLTAAWTLPYSATSGGFLTMPQRTPISRGAGGVWVAYPVGYPTPNGIRVWKLAPSGTTAMGLLVPMSGAKKMNVSLTCETVAPYRLWLVWTETNGGVVTVRAKRSTSDGMGTWGATRVIARPPGTTTITHLSAAGNAGKVDVVVTARLTSGAYALYHTQMLP